MKELQAFLSIGSSLLTFHSSRSLISLLHVFLVRPLVKLTPTLNFRQLLGQALSRIFSGWSNHSNPVFCKHSLVTFNPKLLSRNPIPWFNMRILKIMLDDVSIRTCLHAFTSITRCFNWPSLTNTGFFISNTKLPKATPNCQKIKQKLSSLLRLKF